MLNPASASSAAGFPSIAASDLTPHSRPKPKANLLATSGFFRPGTVLRRRLFEKTTRRNLKFLALLFAILLEPAISGGQNAKTQDAKTQDAKTPDAETPDAETQNARSQNARSQGSGIEKVKIENIEVENIEVEDAEVEDAGIKTIPKPSKLPDFNTGIYYRNKLEFSLETGALPINIPFVFDVFIGGDYSHRPLHYTLVPIFPSLRWQMGDVRGPSILRGNTDLTATLSLTAIPRGPENIYGAFDLGVRRNFVYRNWRAAPYFEFRAGAGFIDAKGPHGAPYAQGEDYTFTLWLGTGVRYNFNSRYSVSLGPAYMHVSNLFLSEPRYLDHGINVTGGVIGFNMRLGKPKPASVH